MAKFYGDVGFCLQSETAPGVYTELPKARKYYGDVVRNIKRSENGAGLNDDLTVNNQISIMADPFAFEHFFAIRYVEWMGAFWNVTSVEVQRPRLILTIGGVYTGELADTTSRIVGWTPQV